MPEQDTVSILAFRIESLERSITQLSSQLSSYVPAREHDLRIQPIMDTVNGMKSDIQVVHAQVEETRSQQNTLREELRTTKDELREAQDKLQIRILTTVVTIIVTVVTSIFIGYITHFFK